MTVCLVFIWHVCGSSPGRNWQTSSVIGQILAIRCDYMLLVKVGLGFGSYRPTQMSWRKLMSHPPQLFDMKKQIFSQWVSSSSALNHQGFDWWLKITLTPFLNALDKQSFRSQDEVQGTKVSF